MMKIIILVFGLDMMGSNPTSDDMMGYPISLVVVAHLLENWSLFLSWLRYNFLSINISIRTDLINGFHNLLSSLETRLFLPANDLDYPLSLEHTGQRDSRAIHPCFVPGITACSGAYQTTFTAQGSRLQSRPLFSS